MEETEKITSKRMGKQGRMGSTTSGWHTGNCVEIIGNAGWDHMTEGLES